MGLLSVSVSFDVLGLGLEQPLWWAISFWNIVLALVAAAPTILSGLIDLATFARAPRPQTLGTIHMTVMLSALGLFVISLVYRHGPQPAEQTARVAATVIDAAGTLLLAVGGWFGGELVYGYGIGLRSSGRHESSL